MTFTIVTYLREVLTALVGERAEKIKREDVEKERLALEVRRVPLFLPQTNELSLLRPKKRARAVHP